MKTIVCKLLFISTVLVALTSASCNRQSTVGSSETNADTICLGPDFSADSAYFYCEQQCAFGPRTMNSKAHDDCRKWIVDKFQTFGCTVEEQNADLKGYDGTILKATNIIAHYRPDAKKRILLCAHWDARPWADNDRDEKNWYKPVLAANDGASGVAVMMEIARLIQNDTTLNIGVDFICFDAEDWGAPQWTGLQMDDSWALGARHWAENYKPKENTEIIYGILLDMVGGENARFYKEAFSMKYAPRIVDRVWSAAQTVGYSGYFPQEQGGGVTDDHVPVNTIAGIPTIDIVPHYPFDENSSFGPTWHTIDDTMEHIDRKTLKAVGQTIIQVLYSE